MQEYINDFNIFYLDVHSSRILLLLQWQSYMLNLGTLRAMLIAILSQKFEKNLSFIYIVKNLSYSEKNKPYLISASRIREYKIHNVNFKYIFYFLNNFQLNIFSLIYKEENIIDNADFYTEKYVFVLLSLTLFNGYF